MKATIQTEQMAVVLESDSPKDLSILLSGVMMRLMAVDTEPVHAVATKRAIGFGT